MMRHTPNETKDQQDSSRQSKGLVRFISNRKTVICIVSVIAGIFAVAGGVYGYIYASTPAHIRKPTYQHYHFRTQILVDSKAVDFSKDEFQEETGASNTCSAAVGSLPIDFHDKMDQMTHVHWSGMTGGEFLKYFGWNFIGGSDDLLGRRYDVGLLPSSVKVYGKLLPPLPEKANFYVYVGDKNDYQKKNWNDFLKSDLETFFGKKSNIGHNEEVSSINAWNWLLPRASAHGGVVDEHRSNKSEEELTRINNLIGNVVVFVQEKEPTQELIKARFDNLVPLHESSCGD